MNHRLGEAPDALSGTLFESQGPDPEPLELGGLQRGGTLSRYLLLDRVGAGGMGVVWAAYDPELDRRVAIKLLRPRRAAGRSEEARTRLIREAQAMARLSHPNVIAVHDVGEHQGQVFVAMEFVEGRTLGRWVRSTRHGWREIVAMFVQAGRGLAQAHRAGLVHRDFKPDNVLIGGDGRARVTDFGLARSVESLTDEGDELAVSSEDARGQQVVDSSPALVTPLTRTGIMVGTPAYMAPEQFEAGQFDARSDQFGFCVALWEAVYGQRPFAGRTLASLEESVKAGRISEPPSEARVPGFVDKALRRGLSVDPAERWPSMDALLTELQRDPALGRRRWLVAGGGVLSFTAALLLAPLLREPEPEPEPLCPDASVHLEGIWDAPRRQQLERAVQGAAVADPSAAWAELSAVLDGYAASWLAMHQDACEATHVRHEQSQELLDLRMQCLEQRQLDLAAKVELLASGEAKVVASASQLLAGLPAIEPCGRRAYLEASAPIPADEVQAEQVAEIRGRLAKAKAKVDVGEYEDMLPVLRELVEEAETVDYAPVQAEALSELAFAAAGTGSAEDAREALEQAVIASIRTGLDAKAARAGIELAYVVGVRLNDHEEGLRWTERVAAWHDRLDAAPLSRARISTVRAAIHERADQLDEAEQALDQTLALLGVDASLAGLAGLGPAERLTATWTLGLRGRVHYRGGRYHAAHASLAAAHDLCSQIHGEDAPNTRFFAFSKATLAGLTGDWPPALAELERLHATREPGGEVNPVMGVMIRVNLVALRLGLLQLDLDGDGARVDAALRDLGAETEGLVRASFPEPDLRASSGRMVLAALARVDGRLDEAEALLDEAEAILAGDPPGLRPDHYLRPGLVRAQIELARGDVAAAATRLEQLEAEAQAAGPIALPVRAEILRELGRARIRLEQEEGAKHTLTRSLALFDELAPAGHPEAIEALELLAEIDTEGAAELRSRSQAIREQLVRALSA